MMLFAAAVLFAQNLGLVVHAADPEVTLTPNSIEFDAVQEGYDVSTLWQEVFIKNNEDKTLNFEIKSSENLQDIDTPTFTIASWGDHNFTVSPKAWLTSGVYNEKITVEMWDIVTQKTEKEIPVKFTVTAAPTPLQKYSITVVSWSANPNEAALWEKVIITADTPDEGKEFDKRIVTSWTVSLVNEEWATTAFEMPWENVAFKATYKDEVKFKVQFDSKWAGTLSIISVKSGGTVSEPMAPAKSWYRFLHRYLSWTDENQKFDFSTPITGDIVLVAAWKNKSSSTSTSTTSTSSDSSTKTTTWSTNTGAISTWDNLTGINLTGAVSTWTTLTWNTQDSLDKSSNWHSGYSQEFVDAYNFAFKNWITTMDDIEKADMNWGLTRIAMAKMLSQYAITVLWKTPDTTKECSFKDVSAQLDAEYNSWVTLACQLGIMWVGIEDFRPNDLVIRAEFATALSRMLYGTADWEPYYATHIEKLKSEWIINNTDAMMQELRWYVMIMLMRSAK